MTTSHARRPRFLARVPENPSPAPARFAGPPPCTAVVELPDRAPAPPPTAHEAARLAHSPEAAERLAAGIATLRAQADRLAEQARSDAIEIAFQVAHRILETEIRQGPEPLFALVRSALRRAGESRRITIRVAPEDAPAIGSEAGRAALGGVTAARVEVVPDASLQAGDCTVETDFGQVDGRLATRLAELRRAVDAAGEGVA